MPDFRPKTFGWLSVAVFSLALLGSPSAAIASEEARDFRDVIRKARDRVFPALVHVAPVVEQFRGGKREMHEVGGSGVIVSADGYAVTNWHVIEKSVTIRVLLADGSTTTAIKVGEDRETDIGLIKLALPDGVDAFPHASFADSGELEHGEFVLAMGAPWGLSRSISQGILSSVNRYLVGKSEYSLWLQTDASINPGNSGGPLVNTDGLVVGINTLGSNSGGDMGFAVPSNTVKKIVDGLRRDGRMKRAWTGVHLQPLRDFSKNIYFKGEEGVLIASVDARSPAQRGGLKVGDLILKVGEKPIQGLFQEDIPRINVLLGDLEVGNGVAVHLRRGSDELDLVLTPRAKGDVEGKDLELVGWNMTVKTINEFENPTLAYFVKEGVFVQGLRAPGNAYLSGLRRGDILVKVDGKKIASIENLRELYEARMKNNSAEKKLLVEVIRKGRPHQLVLDYSGKYSE